MHFPHKGKLTSDSTNTNEQPTQKPISPFRPIIPSPRPNSPAPHPQPHEGDIYRMVSYLPPPLNYQDVSGTNNTSASNEGSFITVLRFVCSSKGWLNCDISVFQVFAPIVVIGDAF